MMTRSPYSRNTMATARLVLECAATGATLLVVLRLLGGQDATRTLVMKIARTGERACISGAKLCVNGADTFEAIYNKSRVTSL